MLQASSPSKHNAMLGQRITHPPSTNFDEGEHDFESPPAKRLRSEDGQQKTSNTKQKFSPQNDAVKLEISDSEADSEDEDLESEPVSQHRTGLENTLPPIQTDKQAIEAYELQRAAEQADDTDLHFRLGERRWKRGKSSIYVDAFNLALETVLEQESHLFDEAEAAVFDAWKHLGYEAQYLYVRLFLRKTSSWHRINKLGYHSDIADLKQAIDALQLPRVLPVSSSQPQDNPGELEPPRDTLGDRFTFADSSEDCISTLEEASSLLLLDELKAIAKEAKVHGKNKKELLQSFRRTSGKQGGLGFFKRSDTEETTASTGSDLNPEDSRDGTPSRAENRDAYWRDKIMTETGSCVRLSLPALKLFERVHLVFYRSTEWTENSLKTIILARIARWNFPTYIVSRSANIFSSRSLLLEFEASVRTQFRVDNILEFNGTPQKEDMQVVLDIFDDVYPRWRVLLAEEQRKEDSIYSTGEGAYLRRLSPAWVYTRIVHKAAYVLGTGKFKDHKREHEVLSELLAQRLFHTSRRGDWYQRKALLEEHYMHLHLPSPSACKDVESRKKHWKRVALSTCEEGLQDQLTHLIHHHDLQKRTMKLEKTLKVPKRQQHEFGHVRLTRPQERTFAGTQILRQASATSTSGRRASGQGTAANTLSSKRGAKTIWLDPAVKLEVDPETGQEHQVRGECSVEEMCLSNYRMLGWKGYHSEGGIVRTLFAYLFFDILFLYIPNVFQTEFQTCPLDLHTDAFYPSRMSEINARLNDISNGDAAGIIERIHNAHSESKTCVIGLDWSFELPDLLEIAATFAPSALSTVMKVMAQEYGQRGGGVPDLFLWRPTREKTGAEVEAVPDDSKADSTDVRGALTEDKVKGEVMFAEVKSENDRLSDTQRMWIDVLSAAGVRVELCHAVAEEVRVRN